MQLILQVVSGAVEDLTRIDASRLIVWVDAGQAIVVGRSGSRADVAVFEDAKMSGSHFRVHCSSDGCLLNDLGSTNGTFVNGTRVTEVVLGNGDIILAGETVFDVQIRGEFVPPRPPAEPTHTTGEDPQPVLQRVYDYFAGVAAEAGKTVTLEPTAPLRE